MTAAGYATWERDSTANNRVVSFVPDTRVRYLHGEGAPAYEQVHPAAFFDLHYSRGRGYWIVRDDATGVFGCGKRISQARKDFQLAVEEHLDVLEQQEALSPELSWQLKYLRERLRA